MHTPLQSSQCACCVQSGSGDFTAPTVRLIKVLLIGYVYDGHDNTFRQLPDMPLNLPMQIWNAKKALRMIGEGQSSTTATVFLRIQKCN